MRGALGSEDGQALRPPVAEASAEEPAGPTWMGPPAPSPLPHPWAPAGTTTPIPTGGQGLGPGRSLRMAAAGALSPEQLQPQRAPGAGAAVAENERLSRLLQLEAPTEPAPGPRMTGRAGAPSCLPPPSPASPGPAGRGRGGQAGRRGGLGQPTKVPEAWSPQPRQGGLRLEAGSRSSWRAQGRRGEPALVRTAQAAPRGRAGPQGRTKPAPGSRGQASPGEPPDHEGAGSLWARTSRRREQGSVGRRGQDNTHRAPGPGAACAQPRPCARLWPRGIRAWARWGPRAGGTCGRRGPSGRGGGGGAGAPWPPWHRPGTWQSQASGQGTHWPGIHVHRGGLSPGRWASPSRCFAQRGGGRGLAAGASNFSRKGKNPGPRQRLLAQSHPPRLCTQHLP